MVHYEMRTIEMNDTRNYIHVSGHDPEDFEEVDALNPDPLPPGGRPPSLATPHHSLNERGGQKDVGTLMKVMMIIVPIILIAVPVGFYGFRSSSKSSSSTSSYNNYGNQPSLTYPDVSDTRPNYVFYDNEDDDDDQVDESPPENFPRVVDKERERLRGKVCTTPTCTKLADDIFSSIDQKMDPCQNFYQYACGGWIQKHTPVPPGTFVWNPMYQLNLENRLVLKKALDQKAEKSANRSIRDVIASRNSAEEKVLNFYLSCMDKKGLRKTLGAQPLRDLFRKIDGWPTFAVTTRPQRKPKSKSNINVFEEEEEEEEEEEDDLADAKVDMDMDNWDFERTLIDMTNRYGVGGGLIKWSVEVDPRDTTKNIIMIRHESLSSSRDNIAQQRSSDPDDDDELSDLRSLVALLFHMEKIARLTGIGNGTSVVRDVLLFQFELNQLTRSFKKPGSQAGTLFHAMSVGELQRKFGLISWTNLLNNGLSKVGKKLSKWDDVLVQEPELFVQLSTFLKKKLATPAGKAVLRNSMMFKVVWQMIPYLSPEFQGGLDLFGLGSGGGNLEEWQTCLIHTEKYFGLALGSMYRAEDELEEKTKKMSQAMMTNIRDTFQDNVDKVSWLEWSVKSQVQQKAGRITSVIGYPDFLPKDNPTKFLDQLYSTMMMMKEDDLFGNVLSAVQFKLKKNWERYQKPASKNLEWDLNPAKAGAYYYAAKNQVIISPGFLQKPFFDVGFPESVNYGAIGMIMGHEIIHGFGDTASIFGNMLALSNLFSLSRSSLAHEFNSRTQCLKDQYSYFKIKNKTLDLEATLGENVADNGGLKMAYYAYKKNERLYGDFYLPRLNLTHDQQFFVASAQMWCAAGTDEGQLFQMANDVHSPGELRVQIPFKNFQKFAETFNCPRYTPMNPSRRCEVY